MGNIIGLLGGNSSNGERRLFKYLTKKFESDPSVSCYYEPLIGDARPDFLLLSPTIGIVVIEVKDYSENSIREVSPTSSWLTKRENEEIRGLHIFLISTLIATQLT